jgi:hypothetical protein
MSSTNKTPNFSLSQFTDTDKPSWRGDVNGDNMKIDTALRDMDTKADTNARNVLDLSKRVDTTETEISDNKSAITALQTGKEDKGVAYSKSDSDAKYSTKSELSTGLATKENVGVAYPKATSDAKYALKTDIPTIPENIQNNIIVTCGDSYSDGSAANKWPNKLIQLLHGWTLKNFGVSGAGFGVSGNKFIDQIERAHSDSSFDNNRVGIVLVAGGRNDNMDYDSAKSLTVSLVGAARNYFPNARIIMVPMLYDKKASTAYDREKAAGVLAGASQAGAEGVNWAWTWNLGNSANFPNGDIHPNEQGAMVIASYMASAINGSYSGRTESWHKSNGGVAQLSITATGGTIFYNFMAGDSASADQRRFSGIPEWARVNENMTYGGQRAWGVGLSNSGTQGFMALVSGDGTFDGNGRLIAGQPGNAGANSAFNLAMPW